jgi:TP901 family phage tail tape measure protein
MTQGALSVKVGGDFSELFNGFKQLERQAQTSGQALGKGLGDGVKQAEGSITQLQSQIKALRATQATLSVDSSEYKQAEATIKALNAQIAAVSRSEVQVKADPSSINALRARLGELQADLDDTKIGSQRFRELQAEINKTEDALRAAGESADDMRILDGVIQGIAFSLTDSLIGAAGQALGAITNVVGEFGRLDTEIRKAAAAGGEAGGYDKLSRAIDQVGIEAAGTQMEVAQLATELVRGGMTVDQANESLGAIVRGAEATGTSFANMGEVVSASIKGFGLQASDATRVVDALVTGANASAASVDGMGMAFKYAAPVAKIMGVSVEELGIAIGLMTNAGIDASEAGVTLRNGLSKLAAAAPQAGGGVGELTGQAKMAAETMAQLGINIYEADGTLKPMETTLLQLKGAFEQLDPASKIRLAANLFGGEDDGAKWLALLNQSEEEIKRMSAAMANTKGATDIARDAMQGFELKLAQLTGTLGSIANVFGKVAATALVPFIDLANAAAGVISGLPGPVKDVGAAVVLMTGALTAATLGMIAFRAALATVQVQSTISAVTDLARMLATNLAGAATVAVVGVQQLGTALKTLSTLSVAQAFGPLVAVLQTGVVTAATAAKNAVLALSASINGGAIISGLQGMGAALLANNAALLKLGVAVAAVTALVQTWQFVLGGGNEAAKEFEASNKAISEALVVLGADLEKTAAKAKESQAGFLGLGEIFREAREGWTLLRLVDETERLAAGFDEVYNGAMAFYQQLKASGEVTDEQKKKAQEYIAELQKVAEAYRTQAERAQVLAVEQAKLGNADVAKFYESQVVSLTANANALDNLRVATGAQIGIQVDLNEKTKTATEQQAAAAEATKERAAAEAELNRIIAEAPARRLEEQVAVGQQLLGLARALAEQEQSRFEVIKSGLEFELSQAEARGASEREIGDIKRQIAALDQQALAARYKALQEQQALEVQLLELSQQKARTEANLDVLDARAQRLKAETELRKAANDEARAAAQAEVNLQAEVEKIQQSKLGLLNQTQPLEQQSLAAQQEIARNGEKSRAAAAGYRIEADGSVTSLKTLNDQALKLKEQTEQRKEIEREINEVIQQAAIQQATERLEVGEKLLSLSRSIAAEEQSRFDIVQAGLEYELQKAQERGASEGEIGIIKQRIADQDRAAAEARFAALLQQQQLEAKMLEIAQRKQILEANLEVRRQQISLLEAEQALREAINSGDQGAINVANQKVQLERLKLGFAGEQFNLLAQTLPLEARSLAAQQQTAINAERAKAQLQGYSLAAGQSAVNMVAVNNNAAALARTSEGFRKTIDSASRDAGKIGRSLGEAQNPADGIAKAFVGTGENAPKAAVGAREFAIAMKSAEGVTFLAADESFRLLENVAQSKSQAFQLSEQMANVARNTAAARDAARTFYQWLEFASRLPGSRWTGGPVEAGESYKINELGQEALLSHGRLSLINAPANSTWRAPADGTVIPAGITARLQDQGMLPGGGGAMAITTGTMSNAALAIEIGKLRQEVGELARKSWNVGVTMKTGPTGSQVMRQMLR